MVSPELVIVFSYIRAYPRDPRSKLIHRGNPMSGRVTLGADFSAGYYCIIMVLSVSSYAVSNKVAHLVDLVVINFGLLIFLTLPNVRQNS